MKILMISPQSPPKNSPESIQVARYLGELDRHHDITLVTTPIEHGWVVGDSSLDIPLHRTRRLIVDLPFHTFTARLLASRYFRGFAFPDKEFWITSKVSSVIARAGKDFDVIYSRTMPFSSALLALGLKKKLNLPWVMHISDPIVDNPYRAKGENEEKLAALESECFEQADAITLTTQGIADFYARKYPDAAHKISVSPNIMPGLPQKRAEKREEGKVKLLYAGALYGERNFDTLLAALEKLRESRPELLENLEFKVAGNAAEDILERIRGAAIGQIELLGRVSYSRVLELQEDAAIVLSIEPEGESEILRTFMPSKILDYLAADKPILALTPEGSPTWQICNDHGFGWAIGSNDTAKLAEFFEKLLEGRGFLSTLAPHYDILEHYTAPKCVEELGEIFDKVTRRQ